MHYPLCMSGFLSHKISKHCHLQIKYGGTGAFTFVIIIVIFLSQLTDAPKGIEK